MELKTQREKNKNAQKLRIHDSERNINISSVWPVSDRVKLTDGVVFPLLASKPIDQ